jgi:hypothetical protein
MMAGEVWAQMTDEALESSARDYIWSAEIGVEIGRRQYTSRRDQIIVEAERRGKPEIITRARASLGLASAE